MSEPQYSNIFSLLYNSDLFTKVKTARILIAGVGGIGSELIKSTILAGFQDLTLIDFDLVDMSNLNRNIFLTVEHALQKKLKVDVISQSITKRFPHVKTRTYNKNIKSFYPDFFREFDIVFCALDDLEARRYLGHMCIIANRIMIESGTQGYAGQVKTQIHGIYACNCCQKIGEIQEVISCSIRAIPTQTVHAVLWAKDFFERLFNRGEDQDLAKLFEEKGKLVTEEEINSLCEMIFTRYFRDDVLALENNNLLEIHRTHIFPISFGEALMNKAVVSIKYEENLLESQRILSLAEYTENFKKYFKACFQRKSQIMPEILPLDKDDNDIIGFICAATNLRVYNFLDQKNPHSKLKFLSLFEVKEKVGNITPTVASANSVVAGIQVSEAIKCLNENFDSLKKVWLSAKIDNKLTEMSNSLPSPSCEICSLKNVYIFLETGNRITLRDFVKFLEGEYCIMMPEISTRNIIFDASETDEEMSEIYKNNLDFHLIKFLAKDSPTENKGFENFVLVTTPHEEFVFHCWIKLSSHLETEIIPDSNSRRERVLTQQRNYLQKQEEEKRTRMNRFYKDHLFDLT